MFSNFFNNVLQILKERNNYPAILIFISIGILTLILDAPKYKKRAYIKEVKIIKAISYSYMVIGGIMYILLLME